MPQRKTGNSLADLLMNEPLLQEPESNGRQSAPKSSKKRDLRKVQLIWWDK